MAPPRKGNGMAGELDTGNSAREQLTERLWQEVTRHTALLGLDENGLGRVRGLLDTVAGRRQPVLGQRQGHRDGWFMPDLDSSPWMSARQFGNLAEELEACYPEIRSEVERELARGAFRPYAMPRGEVENGHSPALRVDERGPASRFDELRLWDTGSPTSELLALPALAKAMQHTLAKIKLLNQFAVLCLPENSRLPSHVDWGNWLVTIQMGIIVPEGCGIRVGGEERSWHEGRCLAFDNSYEHEVWNGGSASRLVLAIHLAHPDLTPTEAQALALLQHRYRYLSIAVGMRRWASTSHMPDAGALGCPLRTWGERASM